MSHGAAGHPDLTTGVERYVLTSSFPQYAYGVLQAAFLGAAMSENAVSALELGVAGGNGLVELERLATEISVDFGLEIAVAG